MLQLANLCSWVDNLEAYATWLPLDALLSILPCTSSPSYNLGDTKSYEVVIYMVWIVHLSALIVA